VGSCLFGRLAQLLELLADAFRDSPQALGVLPIDLARDALQLGVDPVLLFELALVVRSDARFLRSTPLPLGVLALIFPIIVRGH
jgi:hypothetical protein